MSGSIYREIDLEEVIAEYTASASASSAHERAKWGSAEGMENRFRFTLSKLPLDRVRRWLDIGCGEADLFALAEAAGFRFERLVGLDVTPAMVARAKRRLFTSPAECKVGSLEQAGESGEMFDLVTLLGVLQQCGLPIERALAEAAKALNKGGTLFLTTKHAGWEKFISGELRPEANHSWFSLPDLLSATESAGLRVQQIGGFLPRENREVAPEQSHTVYLLAVRT